MIVLQGKPLALAVQNEGAVQGFDHAAPVMRDLGDVGGGHGGDGQSDVLNHLPPSHPRAAISVPPQIPVPAGGASTKLGNTTPVMAAVSPCNPAILFCRSAPDSYGNPKTTTKEGPEPDVGRARKAARNQFIDRVIPVPE